MSCRLWVALRGAFVAVLLLALGAAGPRASLAGEPSLVPAAVADALPSDATVVAAADADLVGNAEDDWAVAYSIPNTTAAGVAVPQTKVAVMRPGANGWQPAMTLVVGFAVGSTLEIVDVDGLNAVIFEAIVGAHSQRIYVLRWNEFTFAPVGSAESNNPSLQLRDVDGDGVPEIVARWSAYCQAYYTSPTLLTVYRWVRDQATFSQATGDYPGLIEETRAGVLRAFDRDGDWRPDGVACLHGALAYLAAQEGDSGAVASECATAASIDAAWDEHVDWSPCRSAG